MMTAHPLMPLAGPLLAWGVATSASLMPATRLLRFTQNQPVRNADRPADRSGRERILLGVRSECRAARRHQPDRKCNRAGRVPVVVWFVAARHGHRLFAKSKGGF
jgi:hypothetical protein